METYKLSRTELSAAMVENAGCGIRDAGYGMRDTGCGVSTKCGVSVKCGVDGEKACPHTENRMLCEQGECLVRNLPTLENFEVCNLLWVLFIIFEGEKFIQ